MTITDKLQSVIESVLLLSKAPGYDEACKMINDVKAVASGGAMEVDLNGHRYRLTGEKISA